jgi:peptide/nickel transport system substrate-binding protein
LILSACKNQNSKNQIHTDADHTHIRYFNDAKVLEESWSKINTVVSHAISDPDNLHPTNGNSSPRSEVLKYTQRSLLYLDYKTQEIIPGLVKSLPSLTEDGLEYTYELKESIKWDDGTELSTSDIYFTALANKCPLTKNHSVKSYWENIREIKIISPLKFIIVMKQKYIQNISFLSSFYILQKKFHDSENLLSSYTLSKFSDTTFAAESDENLKKWSANFNDDKFGRSPKFLNGLGMYKVDEWENGQYIILSKKKNHWSDTSNSYHDISYPEKLIFKLNKDETSQQLQFQNQEFDLSTNISVNTFIKLSSSHNFEKNYNFSMMPTYNYTYIAFNEKPDGNSRKNIFDDIKTRKAIAKLIPVEAIMKHQYKIYSKQSVRVTSNVSPLKKEFDSTLKLIELDIEGAEKLLSDAGWKDEDNNGILEKTLSGKKTSLSLDLNYLSSSPEWRDMALLITEALAKAGIQINPVGMDLKLFNERARAHDFDLMLGAWGGHSLPEDYTQLWHTSSWKNNGSNYSGFGNQQSDALIDSMKYELNDSLRIQLSRRLQKMIYDDQPYVFLYSSLRRNIIHKRFGNQMIFSERPGILNNMLRLLSTTSGITMREEVAP